jgi:hypothetical protein
MIFNDRLKRYQRKFKNYEDYATEMQKEGCFFSEIENFENIMKSSIKLPIIKTDDPIVQINMNVPAGMMEKLNIKSPIKLKTLFWNKIDCLSISKTFWYKLNNFDISEKTIKALHELFFAKLTNIKMLVDNNLTKKISLIDSRKSQTINIIIGKVRKSPNEIVELIRELDPDKLTQDLTLTFKDIIPNTKGINIFCLLY